MSNVVVFRPERTGPAMLRPKDEAVQILFFTGVRYVREELGAPPASEPEDGSAAEACDAFETERLKA